MKNLNSFLYSFLAGACIAIGGTAFLSIDSKVVGALFFCVGLYAVCTHGFNLFTGKVCYLFDNPPSYILWLCLVWVGNLVGAVCVGLVVRFSRLSSLMEKASSICQVKLDDSLLSIFLLAVMCGIMIFLAVDAFKRKLDPVVSSLNLIFGVAVFIICGFEHCVANMFYFTAADMWSGKAVLYLLVMTLGNTVGGVIFPVLRSIKERSEK